MEEETDVLRAKATEVLEERAKELRVELGKISIYLKRNAYEVRAGKRILGRLTQDQLVRCDVEHLLALSRSVWLDVVKPLNVEWPAWGNALRASQWALGRLMDEALDELRLAERAGSKVHPETLITRVIASEAAQTRLREEAQKVAKRSKSASWAARTNFTLSGATCSSAGRMVYTFYKRWKKDEIGYPSWSGPRASLPLRADGITLKEEGKTLVMKFNALGTSSQCVVSPKGGSAWAQAKSIVDGAYKLGAGRLVWNDKKHRWRVSLSYTMPRPVPHEGTSCLVVRRSVQDMLFVMDRDGRTFEAAQGLGNKILVRKQQITARKSELKSGIRVLGKGSWGHGKKRRYRAYQKMQDLEKRTVDTFLKRLASEIRKAAQLSRASTVHLEDFTLPWLPDSSDDHFNNVLKRMPWYQAETTLRIELEEHGIILKKHVNAHDMFHCPNCPVDEDGEKQELRQDKYYLSCLKCGLLIQRPFVAAWNMLLTVGENTDALAKRMKHVSKENRDKRKASRFQETKEFDDSEEDQLESVT